MRVLAALMGYPVAPLGSIGFQASLELVSWDPVAFARRERGMSELEKLWDGLPPEVRRSLEGGGTGLSNPAFLGVLLEHEEGVAQLVERLRDQIEGLVTEGLVEALISNENDHDDNNTNIDNEQNIMILIITLFK